MGSGLRLAGSISVILMHDGRSEDGIKAFFNEVYELYVKARVRVKPRREWGGWGKGQA